MTFEQYMIQHSIKMYIMHGRDMEFIHLCSTNDGESVYVDMQESNVNHKGKYVTSWLRNNGYCDGSMYLTDKFFEMVENVLDK